MVDKSLVEEHWPHVTAVEEFLERLTSTPYVVQLSAVDIVEVLAAHEQRGGSVPWR